MFRRERDEAGRSTLFSDPVYRVLGNERRRYVLELLAGQDDPIDIGTLAELVASRENDQPVAEVSYDQRKSVYTGLYQNHLPLMEQAGLVRSENGWDRIELTNKGREIHRRLNGGDEEPSSRNPVYVALLAFGVGLFVGIWYAPPSVLPIVGFVHGVAAGLSLLAGGHVLMK
jgi:hypothetical protein